MNQECLHNNLKFIRLLSGKKQQDFAVELGISRDQLYTYENGKAKPSQLTMMKFAKIANVSIEDLLTKDLKNTSVNVINPDTKKVEFQLKEDRQNEVDFLKQALESKEALINQQKEMIELLKTLIEKEPQKR